MNQDLTRILWLLCSFLPGWLPLSAQPISPIILGTSSVTEEAYGMATLGDDRLVVAVNEDLDSIGGTDIGIWIVDTLGQILSKSLLGTPVDDFVRGLEPNGNSGYLLTGMRTSYTPFRQQATIRLIDSSGQVKWEWIHPDTASVSELKTARVNEEGIILACGNISPPGEDLNSMVLFFDQEGNLLRTSVHTDSANDLAHAPVPLPDGDWVIAGDQQMPDLTYRPYTMRITGDDSLLWRNVWDEGLNSGSQGITLLQDGNLVQIGETYPGPGVFYFDVFLRKITPDGQSIWMNHYGESGADAGFSVLESPTDGALVATGYLFHEASNSTEAFLLRTDSLGNQQDLLVAGLQDIDYGNILVRQHDFWWIAGFSNVGLDSQVLLARHKFSPLSAGIRNPLSTGLRGYPNPVFPGNTVTLELPGSGHPEIHAELTDIAGRALPCKWQHEGNTLFFPAPKEAGIYQLQLSLDNKPFHFRLLVTP